MKKTFRNINAEALRMEAADYALKNNLILLGVTPKKENEIGWSWYIGEAEFATKDHVQDDSNINAV
tara:strand:+ start:217 stop:414 length:198 start_codon:yes stop_codon:yes gene_type:complete